VKDRNKIMHKILILFLFISNTVNSQVHIQSYEDAFKVLNDMLENTAALSPKKAVYTVENAFFEGELNEAGFNNSIRNISAICKELSLSKLINYEEADFKSVNSHAAIFQVMTDTVRFQLNDTTIFVHYPFQYNYKDFAGEKDWTNMFVSTLMATHMGNCHSLPLLYKLIAEDMGEKAWLALAPNHLYIKLHNNTNGWYNTELTSGQFPTDAWVKSSGYIHLDAIKNGIYMDTLSQKETIALCMIDLAQGYQRKYPENFNPEFILKCCDKALKHFPHYINALLLKAETMYGVYQNKPEKNSKELDDIEKLYAHIHKLGYRKMPKEMYLNWLKSMERISLD